MSMRTVQSNLEVARSGHFAYVVNWFLAVCRLQDVEVIWNISSGDSVGLVRCNQLGVSDTVVGGPVIVVGGMNDVGSAE